VAHNFFYDETTGHEVVTRAMIERRPLWRSALLGMYIELISTTQKKAKAAVDTRTHTDHVDDLVTYGDIASIEPWATDEIVDGLIRYGYMTHDHTDVYRLVKHKMLAHWETVDQLAWRRAQQRDLKDVVLIRQVRYRDGDQCRICHTVVHWTGKDDDTKGTLDHVRARTPAEGNPEALAVACMRCNRIRSDRPDADTFAPHQPAPERPYYTKSTADYLRHGGFATQIDGTPMQKVGEQHKLKKIEIIVPPRPKTPRDPAASGTPRTTTPPGAVEGHHEAARPATQADTAHPTARPASPADTAQRDPFPGTPRDPASRSQSGRNPTEIRGPDYRSDPSPPRTKPPENGGGVEGGEGKGRSSGTGLAQAPARRRARRGRSRSSSHSTQPEEQS
jgi:5-methylcytosine-specific restriction endonuclease McrA